MQISVTGRHVEITAGLKSHILAKLGHLEGLLPKIKKAQVVLTVEKYRHSAEIHTHADHIEYHAKKTTKDLYISIDEAVKALEQQSLKRKDKLRSQHSRRDGAAKAKGVAKSKASVVPEEPQRKLKLPKVVRMRSSSSRPMREDEAALELLESGQEFLVFEDARSGRNHILFKRDDGAFGLIEA
jgi:putative sigma-54 modulation protein